MSLLFEMERTYKMKGIDKKKRGRNTKLCLGFFLCAHHQHTNTKGIQKCRRRHRCRRILYFLFYMIMSGGVRRGAHTHDISNQTNIGIGPRSLSLSLSVHLHLREWRSCEMNFFSHILYNTIVFHFEYLISYVRCMRPAHPLRMCKRK